ncbi:MAG: hypothetical protein ABFC63_02455 [Thermoguttaceae bacterium]
MSDEPTVVILLEGESRIHRPGDTLAGEYWIESIDAEQVKAIEASVLWHTEGKGDEDMAVHEFWRRHADQGPFDSRHPQRFSTVLPNSPLSYDGQIVKLRWCVRVRALLHRGKDIVSEKAFRLGDVPPAKLHGD